MNKEIKIFVAGHSGMLGSATVKALRENGFNNLLLRKHKELDLTNQNDVNIFFSENKPELVILAAARVGGIQANIDNPAVFLYDNLMIELNVIHAAYKFGTAKLVFLGSSCIYPKEAPQPMKEEYLMTGLLEPTNEGYAIAKIGAIKMLESYKKQYGFNSISLMPCNLYGPNDSFDLKHAHVLSSLVRKFTDARDEQLEEITLWGRGIARREFMHVNDVARGILFMIDNYDNHQFINIGWGTDVSIKELAEIISKKIGFMGMIKWDSGKPDGMLRKCMDVSKMRALGFQPEISLSDGIDEMINIYKNLKNKL
jgi:GDP-L-fucose synthase